MDCSKDYKHAMKKKASTSLSTNTTYLFFTERFTSFFTYDIGGDQYLYATNGNLHNKEPLGAASINPDYNPNINPDYKPSISPDYNPNISPDYNPNINPDCKPSISPEYNPNISPGYKPNIDPDYNPKGLWKGCNLGLWKGCNLVYYFSVTINSPSVLLLLCISSL